MYVLYKQNKENPILNRFNKLLENKEVVSEITGIVYNIFESF